MRWENAWVAAVIGMIWRLGAVVLAPPLPVSAQQNAVFELFRITWTDSVQTALDRYSVLPANARSPAVLIGLADQLLWTGRPGHAIQVLSVAESHAPQTAEIAFQQGRANLQRGETAAALRGFERGLRIMDLDAALSENECGAERSGGTGRR